MAAPKGSKNALGNKGGGRKSAYQEKADAELLNKMFLGQISQDEIEKAIQSGKFSVRERFLLTAMEGDTRVLTAMFNKVFPDMSKLDVKHEGTVALTQELKDAAAELAKKLKDADR